MAARLDQDFVDEMKRRIEEARKVIKVKETVEALQACVEGTRLMDREQIKAAEILLKKSLPDLKEIEHKTSNSDLADFLAKGRERAANRNTQH